MKEIGIYVHIPFCKRKCYYCDFISFQNVDCIIEKYIDALVREIKYFANSKYLVKTIYIGGGTPSYIDSKFIQKIVKTIRQYYKCDDDIEATIELNPGTYNYEKVKNYFEVGINRLSIGLQSANDNILKSIGRIHNYKQYSLTLENAKKAGFTNINTDIMIGLPKQTIYDVEQTINKLIEKEIQHISVYSLILEENTKLCNMVQNGEIQLPSEEAERRMYWRAKEILEKNGFIHYEISNFAKSGYFSKHNLDCWNQKEYLGFGISASSYINMKRYSNTSNIKQYISNINSKQYEKNEEIEEVQNLEMQKKEFMLLGLRKIEGINIKDFINQFHENPIELYKEKLQKLSEQKLINVTDEKIQLTNIGVDLGNLVWSEFI